MPKLWFDRHMYLTIDVRMIVLVHQTVLTYRAVVAQWLRRLTRNQFRSAGVGLNPTDRESFIKIKQVFYGTLQPYWINTFKLFTQPVFYLVVSGHDLLLRI